MYAGVYVAELIHFSLYCLFAFWDLQKKWSLLGLKRISYISFEFQTSEFLEANYV